MCTSYFSGISLAQTNFLGEYKYSWMEGCITIQINPNNKVEYINNNWRGEFEKSGFWESKNDSSITIYLVNTTIDTLQFKVLSDWGIEYISKFTPKFNDYYLRTKSFDSIGNVSFTYKYEKGKKYQTHFKLFPNKQVKEVVRYKHFRLHGAHQIFDQNGELISEIVYKKGKMIN